MKLVDEVEEIKQENIKDFFKRFKEDIEQMHQNVDEDVVNFRYYAQQVRNSYKKVVDEELESTYALWEQMDDLRTETKSKLQMLREVTKGLQDDLKQVKQQLDGFSIYGLTNLLELVEKVRYMDEADREILYRVLDIKRKK